MRWIGASYARSSGHISARKSKSRSSRAKPRPDQDCEHDAADPARKILGKQTGGPPLNEAEHFWRCEACCGYFDMRDLSPVFDHEGPLPHPVEDRQQALCQSHHSSSK